MAERGIEHDFPAGHPARGDYDPASPEALEYARRFVHPLGERDFAVDHPAALDTAGNMNAVKWAPGIDPRNPDRQEHSGRTPAQVAGIQRLSELASKAAQESPVLQPIEAQTVADAMNKKRKATGHDVLTADEYAAVLTELHLQPRPQGE